MKLDSILILFFLRSVVSEIARSAAEARKKNVDVSTPNLSVSHGKLSNLKPKVRL